MTSDGGDDGKEFVDDIEDDRKDSSGDPLVLPDMSNDETPDSLELTPLLVLLVLLLALLPLLRSAIGEVDNSPRLSIISGGVTWSPSPSSLPPPPPPASASVVATPTPPGNQLGKLLFSVSIRS